MRILFFSHYFPPEGNAPASRTYENCRRWAGAGHTVTVITCAPNVPDGKVYPGYRNRLRSREEIDGIGVIRVWSYLAANKGTVKRILNFISYMFSASVCGLFLKKPDVIIATSPQFFCGWAGLITARVRRVPFILEIRDLWPETIEAIGAMENPKLLRFLGWLARKRYAGADYIVTVGEGYRRNLIRLGVPPDKVGVIHNGADLGFFHPREPEGAIRRRYGLEGKFVCSYVGTLGLCSGLEVVPKAGELLEEIGREDVVIMLVGDGAIRDKLEEESHRRGIGNVILTGRQPKESIPNFIAASDACFAHLKKSELFKTVLPSKFFEGAAMGKPFIMGVAGEAALLVEKAKAGLLMEPENPRELADCLIYLADHPEEARRFGLSGKEYVSRHHDRDGLARDYLEIIERVIEGNASG